MNEMSMTRKCNRGDMTAYGIKRKMKKVITKRK